MLDTSSSPYQWKGPCGPRGLYFPQRPLPSFPFRAVSHAPIPPVFSTLFSLAAGLRRRRRRRCRRRRRNCERREMAAAFRQGYTLLGLVRRTRVGDGSVPAAAWRAPRPFCAGRAAEEGPPAFRPRVGKARLVIEEGDIEESFTRGSGKGGQKVNKTSNCVFLLHRPTGVTVKCHDQRSLQMNRKLARKILADKVDVHLNGEGSRLGKKAEAARAKKARAKRRSRNKHGKGAAAGGGAAPAPGYDASGGDAPAAGPAAAPREGGSAHSPGGAPGGGARE